MADMFNVRKGLGAGYASNSAPPALLTVMGMQVVVDFITASLLDGRGYQVRAGTIATGLAAGNVLSDTVADMSADALSGTTIIPIRFGIGIRGIATGTTLQVAVKAVGAVSTAGTAFVPLPLKQDGSAAVSTARVQADTVTVTAELATTTRRLFEFEHVNTQTPTSALGAVEVVSVAASAADLLYIGVGPACVYVQVAATTAFNLYFATLDYLEYQTNMIN